MRVLIPGLTALGGDFDIEWDVIQVQTSEEEDRRLRRRIGHAGQER